MSSVWYKIFFGYFDQHGEMVEIVLIDVFLKVVCLYVYFNPCMLHFKAQTQFKANNNR